jgi:hypothetical protein
MTNISKRAVREAKKIFWPQLIAGVAFLLSFAFACYVWAGAALTPNIGSLLVRDARAVGVLEWVYSGVGKPMVSVTGLSSSAQMFVERHFSHSFPKMLEDPGQARALFFQATGSTPQYFRAAHHAAPWLFLAWLLFTVIKPKPNKTFGTR